MSWYFSGFCVFVIGLDFQPVFTNPSVSHRLPQGYCRAICATALKNYQAWYHRRWLLQRLPPTSFSLQEEKDSLKETFNTDLKNYSTWVHRCLLSRYLICLHLRAALYTPLSAVSVPLPPLLTITLPYGLSMWRVDSKMFWVLPGSYVFYISVSALLPHFFYVYILLPFIIRLFYP